MRGLLSPSLASSLAALCPLAAAAADVKAEQRPRHREFLSEQATFKEVWGNGEGLGKGVKLRAAWIREGDVAVLQGGRRERAACRPDPAPSLRFSAARPSPCFCVPSLAPAG